MATASPLSAARQTYDELIGLDSRPGLARLIRSRPRPRHHDLCDRLAFAAFSAILGP